MGKVRKTEKTPRWWSIKSCLWTAKLNLDQRATGISSDPKWFSTSGKW